MAVGQGPVQEDRHLPLDRHLPGLDPDFPVVGTTSRPAVRHWRGCVNRSSPRTTGWRAGAVGSAPTVLPAGALPSFTDIIALARTFPAGSEGVLFAPWLAGSGVRSRTATSAVPGSICRCARTARSWSFRSRRGGAEHQDGCSSTTRSSSASPSGTSDPGRRAQSDLWCAIIASVLNVRVERGGDPLHATAWGRVVVPGLPW